MHRFIMNDPKSKYVDHIDRDGLNNKKSNLRLCNAKESACNRGAQANSTSKFKGVSWIASRRKWQATIGHNGLIHFLGYFKNEKDVAVEYDNKARILFGNFAFTNF